MTFPKEKIFTLDLESYLRLYDKDIKNYDMVSLHGIIDSDCRSTGSFATKFAELIPENTEVVVSYRLNQACTNSYYYVSPTGIALIPKPRKRNNPQISD